VRCLKSPGLQPRSVTRCAHALGCTRAQIQVGGGIDGPRRGEAAGFGDALDGEAQRLVQLLHSILPRGAALVTRQVRRLEGPRDGEQLGQVVEPGT
jgi:hypothetical protein